MPYKVRDRHFQGLLINTDEHMNLAPIVKSIISLRESDDAIVYVSFNSHRARERAERLLQMLPNCKTSFRHTAQFYPMSMTDVAKIEKIPGVIVKSKLPGNPDDWINCRSI